MSDAASGMGDSASRSGQDEHRALRPGSEAELAEILRAANGPIQIAGGGTRRPGGAHGRLLETGALAGIRLYEPGALTLVAGAGTPLADIEAALATEGQRLAFEPPDMAGLLGRDGLSTLGGVIATNASGPRRVQAGAARDFMLGLRFVDGTGAVVANGGRVMKNVTGYDLSRLLTGSRGRLGVITEVALKVLPAPEQVATLVIEGRDEVAAIADMARALRSPFEVTGAAHWPGRGTFLRLEGFATQVSRRAALLREMFGGEIVEGAGPWAEIGCVAPFHDLPGDVWRLLLRATDAPAVAARSGAEGALYDWGGGLLWLRTTPGTDLRARLGPFGGYATLVRATAQTFATLQAEPPLAPDVARLEAGLRARFDPRGVFCGASPA